MKKQIFLRGFLGFPIGILIGYIITIVISLKWGHGNYIPCIMELVEIMGSQINAVILQTLLCGLIGSSFSVSSLIWEVDKWSIFKQTGIYFSITSIVMMPIAYFLYWMEHSFWGVISYFGIFIVIFIIVWIIKYCIWRIRIIKINKKLHK